MKPCRQPSNVYLVYPLVNFAHALRKLECFLRTRKKEHIRNVKLRKTGPNIAAHAWRNNHSIDFNNARVIDKGNFRIRKTVESWHTPNTNEADNNSKPLPKQYSILLD